MAGFEKNETQTKVIDLIASELNIDKKIITEESALSQLGADSLDMVEIIMKLEEQFGIEISDEESEKLKTVRDVVAFVQSKKS